MSINWIVPSLPSSRWMSSSVNDTSTAPANSFSSPKRVRPTRVNGSRPATPMTSYVSPTINRHGRPSPRRWRTRRVRRAARRSTIVSGFNRGIGPVERQDRCPERLDRVAVGLDRDDLHARHDGGEVARHRRRRRPRRRGLASIVRTPKATSSKSSLARTSTSTSAFVSAIDRVEGLAISPSVRTNDADDEADTEEHRERRERSRSLLLVRLRR